MLKQSIEQKVRAHNTSYTSVSQRDLLDGNTNQTPAVSIALCIDLWLIKVASFMTVKYSVTKVWYKVTHCLRYV